MRYCYDLVSESGLAQTSPSLRSNDANSRVELTMAAPSCQSAESHAISLRENGQSGYECEGSLPSGETAKRMRMYGTRRREGSPIALRSGAQRVADSFGVQFEESGRRFDFSPPGSFETPLRQWRVIGAHAGRNAACIPFAGIGEVFRSCSRSSSCSI